MKSIHIFDIAWDCEADPKSIGLPTDMIVNFNYNPTEDEISDYLSDTYGWCHNGFKYEIIH